MAVVNSDSRESRFDHDDYHGAQEKDVNDKFHQNPFEAFAGKFFKLWAKMVHLGIYDCVLRKASRLQNILVNLLLILIFVPYIK